MCKLKRNNTHCFLEVMEEKITLEQIVDTFTQADDELNCAVQYKDRKAWKM